jgi:DNA invertase Pin-like site-specific DNA recombinase
VSGVTLERPELQRLLADCRAGNIVTVITKDPDRLSWDIGQLIALLHSRPSRFVSLGYGVQPPAPGSQNTGMILTVVDLVRIESSSAMHRAV